MGGTPRLGHPTRFTAGTGEPAQVRPWRALALRTYVVSDAAVLPPVSINSAIQELVGRGLRSVDHIGVLLCLRDSTQSLTAGEIATATRFRESLVIDCLRELVAGRLVEHDLKTAAYTYVASADDRVAVDAIALLHTQWPETLAKLFVAGPPKPIKSFSTAFRLRIDREDK